MQKVGDKDIGEYIVDKTKFEELSRSINETIATAKSFFENTARIDELKAMIWNG